MTTRFLFLTFILVICSSAHAQRFFSRVYEEVDITLDITYGNAENYLGEDETLLLDFYEGQADTMAYRPLVVYVHGGGFTDVSQSKSLVHIAAYCDSLAARGYAAAGIDYRLDTSISNRAVINAMHDAKAAVRFFKVNYETYKIDTNLIFIGGESAGAVTALTTTYINSPEETGYPDVAPYSDDLSIEGNSGNPGPTSNTKAALCFCGGTQTVLGDLLFDTLAIETPEDPALLMVSGTEDELIPILYSLEVAIRANNVGVPYLFYTLPEAGHCPWFFPLEDSWLYLDTLIDYSVPFLYSCVTGFSSVEEQEIQNKFKLFPNPITDVVTVSFESKVAIKVEVFDLAGQLVYADVMLSNAQIDFSKWDPGVYLVRAPEEGWSQRVIKK